MKRIISVFLSLTVIASLFCTELTVRAAETDAESVDIYALNSWENEYISIPDSFDVSYQITAGANASYTVESGDSVEVSDTGLVTPATTTTYWYGNMGTTFPMEGREPTSITVNVNYGESVVKVTDGGTQRRITVNVKSYGNYYAQLQMRDFIDQMITDDMTVYEKVEQICRYVASFDYSARYSSARGMIISGGGDCWASTDAIVEMCDMIGIKAWARNGNRDAGAGSSHQNAIIEVREGEYLIAEAGYSETAPRSYDVTPRNSLFSYRHTNGGVEVYQYDGYDTSLEKLVVPDTIDGKPVTKIGDSFISMNRRFKEVLLPNTVVSIGDSAFNSCENLEKINIPDSLKSIGDFVFTACNKLTKIDCSFKNRSFTVENGVLYNKNKTEILYAPAVSSLEIPDTVTSIGYYAFYHNYNIQNINIPSNVSQIAEGAFCNCTSLADAVMNEGTQTIGLAAFADCSKLSSVTVPNGVTEIGGYAFASTPLTRLALPDTLQQIGENAFRYCSSLEEINFKGTQEQWDLLTAESDISLSEDTVVNCEYSEENDPLIYDINKDGVVSGEDTTALLKYVIGYRSGADLNFGILDANRDGNISVKDATFIQRIIVS